MCRTHELSIISRVVRRAAVYLNGIGDQGQEVHKLLEARRGSPGGFIEFAVYRGWPCPGPNVLRNSFKYQHVAGGTVVLVADVSSASTPPAILSMLHNAESIVVSSAFNRPSNAKQERD